MIEYEIYEIAKSGQGLVAKGKRNHSARDVKVRFNADPRVPDDTHFVLVKAGSVLRLQ